MILPKSLRLYYRRDSFPRYRVLYFQCCAGKRQHDGVMVRRAVHSAGGNFNSVTKYERFAQLKRTLILFADSLLRHRAIFSYPAG